jgi:hypothetical protein
MYEIVDTPFRLTTYVGRTSRVIAIYAGPLDPTLVIMKRN